MTFHITNRCQRCWEFICELTIIKVEGHKQRICSNCEADMENQDEIL